MTGASENIVFNLQMIETFYSAGPASWGGKKEISDQIFGPSGDATELLDVVVTYHRPGYIWFSNRKIILPFKIIRCIL